MEHVIFLIEVGRALELVKQHIQEARRVREAVKAMALELGVQRIRTDLQDGTLRRVIFDGARHPDFAKGDKNGSWPKKGTEWAKRFDAQVGYPNQSKTIAEAFGVPVSVEYAKGQSIGYSMIGHPLRECGFLYLGEEGPYGMWVPNVPAEVAAYEAKGYTVAEPAKSFKMEFDGCRYIEREEWDIIVAQHNLAQKRARAAEKEAA